MKIFLTGGTGFIGSNFINQAHLKGHTIVALRRPGSVTRVPLGLQPTWVEGALDGNFDKYFKDIDVFLHLAAHSANYPYDNLENCLYWNLTAPLKLIKQAAEQGVKRFIIGGSCFEYGVSANKFDELKSDSPLEPNNNYAISKAASSIVFLGIAQDLQIQIKILRIFQVYGDGEQESRLWPSLKKAARKGSDFHMTKGEQIRDFIPVERVAQILSDALTKFANCVHGCEVTHVATGIPQKTIDFVNYWWIKFGATGKIVAGTVPYRDGEMMRIVSSSDSILQ
jgi:dTDP-6-deoxy-L-talose 4-dehydrogenase (NAD+)